MKDAEKTLPRGAVGIRVEHVESFRVEVIEGPDAGRFTTSVEGRVIVGRGEGVTLRLTDPMVSQFHVEFERAAGGVRVRDLESSNGPLLSRAAVREVLLRDEVELSVGASRLRVTLGGQRDPVVTSAASHYHELIGSSPAMRAVYARLDSAAPTKSTVLVTGESGTGKELAARAVHDASTRARGPFEVIHCGGTPVTLIESELFGHAKGAFTGAWREHDGAFERADGGTVFLDEIGELPLDSQPKLLRVLEDGTFQRLGDTRMRKVDVRVVAATNRDLRAMVNDGRFRADLYYRLAVIQVRMPALRERMDDLPRLARALITRIASEKRVESALAVDDALLADLQAYRWPGNVRELRNYLEQWMVLRQRPERPEGDAPQDLDLQGVLPQELLDQPLRDVRDRVERMYLVGLLERCAWNASETARRAGIDRVTLFRMMRRYQIERPT